MRPGAILDTGPHVEPSRDYSKALPVPNIPLPTPTSSPLTPPQEPCYLVGYFVYDNRNDVGNINAPGNWYRVKVPTYKEAIKLAERFYIFYIDDCCNITNGNCTRIKTCTVYGQYDFTDKNQTGWYRECK